MWALIAILFLNMSQRKIPNSSKKRFATIYIATALLLFEIGTVTILTRGWNHNWAWLFLAICIALLFIFRKRTFPFRLTCVECGAKPPSTESSAVMRTSVKTATTKPTPTRPPGRDEEVRHHYTTVDSVSETTGKLAADRHRDHLPFADGKVLLIDKKTGLGKGLPTPGWPYRG